ncbi:hypothetical protein [Paenibacillus koleovorans]|uniref:hypothetical protein n=1 Tax=Paenibacillus koleovorans TaxID=121608 RepID=UPI000FDC0035|nr:hypothetical protein [Paenibacillus koleovorans]
MKKTLWLLLLSFIAGHLLLIFSWLNGGLFRYVFSIGALLIGVYFFKQYDSLKLRIWFIVVSVFFYLLLTIIYTMIYVATGKIPILNLVPPGTDME